MALDTGFSDMKKTFVSYPVFLLQTIEMCPYHLGHPVLHAAKHNVVKIICEQNSKHSPA